MTKDNSFSFQDPIFQVSEYNELINNHLNLLGEVTVEGEISRFEVKNRRLIFMTIKDGDSALDVFALTHMVRNYSQFQAGMLVRVSGAAGLYKGSGKFRLMANSITPQGEGSLQIAFQKLKTKLEVEGLFDQDRKRPLPQWPLNIGLLTARNSSAYHDVVKILTSRMSGLSIKHLPITVQGLSAPATILKALDYCNRHADHFDLLILCRGGGSLEDLQAFNDEAVARAVFASKVPIISAVGHEDDWSLTDFTADMRASTPSNAAEIAVRDRREVLLEVTSQLQYIKHQLINQLNREQHYLERLSNQLKNKLVQPIKQVGELINRFESQQVKLIARVRQEQQQLTNLNAKLNLHVNHWLKNNLQHLERLTQLLNALDYQQVLKRGFSITFDSAGKVIQSVSQAHSGQSLTTKLSDGQVSSIVQ